LYPFLIDFPIALVIAGGTNGSDRVFFVFVAAFGFVLGFFFFIVIFVGWSGGRLTEGGEFANVDMSFGMFFPSGSETTERTESMKTNKK
jgi:hypothetical protein